MTKRRTITTRPSGRDTVVTENANQFVVYHRKELWVAHIEGGQLKTIVNNENVVRRIIAHFEAKAIGDSTKLAYVRAKYETSATRRPERLKTAPKAQAKKKSTR